MTAATAGRPECVCWCDGCWQPRTECVCDQGATGVASGSCEIHGWSVAAGRVGS